MDWNPFDGPGEMREACRAFDWSGTPLGAVHSWSTSLRTTAAMAMDSRQPMVLFWGPELAQIFNDAFRPSLGTNLDLGTALGAPARQFWSVVWEAVGPQLAQVWAGGDAIWFEDIYRPIERDGRLDDVWWTYSYSAVHGDDGEIEGILVVCQETTGRVRAEQALKGERERLSEIIRQAPAFMAVLRGPTHIIELTNDGYNQLVGYRNVLGKPVAEALPEVVSQGYITILDQVFATGTPFVGRDTPVLLARTRGANGDGGAGVEAPALDERFVSFVYHPLNEGLDRSTGILVHGVDVTDQVRARRDIEHLLLMSEQARHDAEIARADADIARRHAESADKAKSDFLATMSHEIRTPINAVLGYTELLDLGLTGAVNDAQRVQLARIRSSAQHLLGLINEVLDLAKIEAGEVRVDSGAMLVTAAADAAIALVRPQAAAKSLVLSEACTGADKVAYLGDETRVRQILVNLLANAVKFTPVGGHVDVSCTLTEAVVPAQAVQGSSSITDASPRPYVTLKVSDSGVGISPDQVERIFEPFTQAAPVGKGSSPNAYTRPAGGTGLGLTISRRLARLMGGDVSVESVPGVGSTFTLWLPAPERRMTPRVSKAPRMDGLREDGTLDEAHVAAARARGIALTHIGDALIAQSNAIVKAWVVRLRTDPVTADRATGPDAEVEDHGATFITDMGLALRALGTTAAESPESAAGEAAALMRDGTAILGLISERHGAQRARLRWTESALEREVVLLGAVMDEAVLRTRGDDPAAVESARTIVRRLLDKAFRVSLGGFRLAAEPSE